MVANRGPIVTSLTADSAAALYEVRAILEPLVGRLFATRASEEQVRQLSDQYNAVKAAIVDNVGIDAVIAEKDAFYSILLEGSGNPVLTTLFQTIQARIQVLRRLSMGSPGRGLNTVAELNAVLAAVQKRDPDAAWAACEAHVNSAASVALSRLDNAARAAVAD